jgi:hypothetical protein
VLLVNVSVTVVDVFAAAASAAAFVAAVWAVDSVEVAVPRFAFS